MMIFVDVMIQISFAIGINSFLEIHFGFSIIWLVTHMIYSIGWFFN